MGDLTSKRGASGASVQGGSMGGKGWRQEALLLQSGENLQGPGRERAEFWGRLRR